jgi:preprotein translocase subunit SecG
MVFTLLMVLYVVLAVFMIGFILIQRGAGAAAGSGFGAGASATVFGARGASSFLTKATKWLAICFFALTLGMAVYIQRTGLGNRSVSDDLGVMSGVAAPAAEVPAPAASDVPVAPQLSVPTTDAPPATDIPAVPATDTAEQAESQPADESEDDGGQ